MTFFKLYDINYIVYNIICQNLIYPETDIYIVSVGAAWKVFPDSFF